MNQCVFSSDRIYRYVLRCQCAPLFAETASTSPFADPNSDRAQYSNTPGLHYHAQRDSRTKDSLPDGASRITLPPAQCRPRKRGALHQKDAVGRTKCKRIAWIGLNPSTADEVTLDQTLATVCRYSRNWGFSEVVMLNLFAFRATDPRDLRRATDPIGPDNDEHLLTEVRNVDRVIACWGGQGRFLERDKQVSDLLNVSFECLLRNRTGAPHHPLYVKSRIRPKPFRLNQIRN